MTLESLVMLSRWQDLHRIPQSAQVGEFDSSSDTPYILLNAWLHIPSRNSLHGPQRFEEMGTSGRARDGDSLMLARTCVANLLSTLTSQSASSLMLP